MALPSFDEQALASLTKKIQTEFSQSKSKTTTPHKIPTKKSRTADAPPAKTPAAPSYEARPRSRHISNGKKRDARGLFKQDSDEATHKTPSDGRGKNGSGAEKAGQDILEDIIALGGEREDLELIDGLDSASELELEETGSRKGLKKDLASFVKELGIEHQKPQDQSSDEEDMETQDILDGENEVRKTEPPPSAPVVIQDANTTPLNPVRKASTRGSNAARLIFEPRPDWHAMQSDGPAQTQPPHPRPPPHLVTALQNHAMALLKADNESYASNHLSSSSNRFLSTIMTSGTLSDKISALTLVVQESPIHTMKAFDNLLGLARKRSRGQAVTALGALKDLLGQGVVLPADRRLRAFGDQPGLRSALATLSHATWKPGDALPAPVTDLHLLLWAYEDWLKRSYFEMIQILETWCNDEVEFARGRAVQYVWELLKEKPEQEANLLRLLVNKLGDPDKKIASKTSFLLLQLQTSHPLMTPVIISSIESELLFRPGQSAHARYYAIITLNQTVLSDKEQPVAGKLLEIYFSLFVVLLKQVDGAAPPDASQPSRKLVPTQGGGGKAGKHARRKAEREAVAVQADEALTEKMISAVLTGVNRALPFAASDDKIFDRHLDTLFKITHSSNFNTSIQALLLIQQLTSTKQIASNRFYRTLYESLLDPRLLTSSKQAMYLNLLFRSLNSDLNVRRVQAFVKRLLQVVMLHQPPFVCGTLFLISELERTFPRLRSAIDQAEEVESDDVEIFHDMPDEQDANPANGNMTVGVTAPPRASPVRQAYDGRKRDPEHSGADQSCLWELIPFLSHFHPSVTLFASRLLQGQTMPPKPDLSLHTMIHFLDRFVYRNAKSLSSPRGTSIMQPLAGEDNRGMLLSSRDRSRARAPLNNEKFWAKRADDIAVDEVFFHKYFNQVGKGGSKAAKKRKEKGRDEAADGQAEEEEDNDAEIWEALVQSRPELEGSEDGDSDVDLDDMLQDDEDEDEDDDEDEDEADEADDGEEENLALWSDGDALLQSDDEIAPGMDAAFQEELEEGNLAGVPPTDDAKSVSGKGKRRKLKHLPTFASVDDYAEMLAGDDD
ncbi:MAG: hypothetical protein M1838_005978 [Thelocarpon superellum]|nr:MAG: hypothetical protein M1838_005978 [Thelocarpon superellum]